MRYHSFVVRHVLCAALAIFSLTAITSVLADALEVTDAGTTTIPTMQVPSSTLMSPEGNASRVEHILTERSLKGRAVGEFNAALFGPWLQRTKNAFAVSIRDATIAGLHVLIYEPRDGIVPAMRNRVLLNLHGGGFVGCFIECGGLESIPIAALTGARVVSVDYRVAPAAKFPDASEDVAAVYRELLKTTAANHLGVFGCSAGGILTAQSIAWFQQHGLPRPAAAGIFCAGADSSMSGDSRIVGMLLGDGEMPPAPSTSTAAPALGYMRAAPLNDPMAYPATDKSVLEKFPPTLIIVGTRDFALSSAVNLHSKLVSNGVDARLHVWEGGRHAFFYDERVPEAREAYAVMARFFTQQLR